MGLDLAWAGRLVPIRWALLFGNFAIGCGVMVVAGSLNDLTRSLEVSVALGGQLIAIGAMVMCFGAPLLAGWVSGFDRRRLLAWSLLWFAVGHGLCALMPSYATLWPMRALTVLGAAVFTPQAAAAIGYMSPPEQRGRAITFIFLGWSVSSVLGMPMSAWIGETFGWRTAFGTVAGLALVAAAWVAWVMPNGVKPAALSLAAWKSILRHPVLMAMVAVTALQGAGQFTLLSYFAPYAKGVLQATPVADHRPVRLVRRLRPAGQPAAEPPHRPGGRRPRRHRGDVPHCPEPGPVAAGHQHAGCGAGGHPLGPGVFCSQFGAAGAPGQRGTGAGRGTDGTRTPRPSTSARPWGPAPAAG